MAPRGGPRATSDIGPYVLAPEWLLDAAVSDRAKLLFLFLGRYADQHDGTCFPSRATLAARLGASRDSVDRAMKELLELGAVRVEPRRDRAGDPTSNLYRVFMVSPGKRGVAAPVPIPISKAAATGGRTGAARGGRRDAAQNYNQLNENQGNESEAALADVIRDYERLFEAATTERPAVGDADRRILAHLLDKHGVSKVARALVALFRSTDEFVVQSGYALALFRNQFNAFLLKSTASGNDSWRDTCAHKPRCAALESHLTRLEHDRTKARYGARLKASA